MSCQSHPKAQPANPNRDHNLQNKNHVVRLKIKDEIHKPEIFLQLHHSTPTGHYKELETLCISETLSFFIYSLLAASGP